MFCPNCGTQLPDNSTHCSNCGVKIVVREVTQSDTPPVSRVEYAGFWRRLAAAFLDGIILWAISFVVGLIFGLLLMATDEITITVVSYILGTIVGWLYYAVFESSSKQATLGKMALGIIVTDSQGNRISFLRATGRYLAKILSAFILCIGYLMIAFTAKKQGLHDMLADTLVVLR